MRVCRLTAEEWFDMAETAHLVCFNEKIDPIQEKIDFALLVIDNKDVPAGYVTVKDIGHGTLYWQYGGSFPGTKETGKVLLVVRTLLEYCRSICKRVYTRVLNTNFAMLRVYMKLKLLVVGLRTFEGETYLELFFDYREAA